MNKKILSAALVSFSIIFLFSVQNISAIDITQSNLSVYIRGGNGNTGYNDLRAINVSNVNIINTTLTNYACTSRNCNFTIFVSNENFTQLTNYFTLDNLNNVSVLYNASDNTWRDISELRGLGFGAWNISNTSLTSWTINYSLGGADGYNYGIRDNLAGGSYWLDENGTSLETGLVGYWQFNEGSGTVVNDSSGYRNSGSWTTAASNVTWVSNSSCKFGNCLGFDGSNDFVNIPENNVLDPQQGSFTISAWVKPTSLPDTTRVILGKYTGGAADNGWALFLHSSDVFDLSIGDGANNPTSRSTTSAIVNNWYHVVGVRDYSSRTISLYVNGVREDTDTDTSDNINSANSLRIGASASSDTPFPGYIDDIRVYNRALSAEEIKRLYQSTSINLKSDFVSARAEPYIQLNLTNSTGQTIFQQATENILLDNSPITTAYPVNASTTYFFDWKDNDWKVWQKNNYVDALVGWWKMDDGQGQSVIDFSEKGNVGIFGNTSTSEIAYEPIWVSNSTCRFGSCLYFGGSQFVNSTTAASLNVSSLTIESWVMSTQQDSLDMIASRYNTGANKRQYALLLTNGKPTLYVSSTGSNSDTVGDSASDTTISNNSWHHIVGTFDNGTMKIYVDGKLTASKSSTTVLSLHMSDAQFFIGRDSREDRYFNGYIDDVKIYSRALSAEEIKSEYLNTKRGMPDWTDPRFKQEFKWMQSFSGGNQPGINLTYLMTAVDPFVRIFVDEGPTGYASAVDTSTIGYWQFNEGSGVVTSADYSMYANTINLTNMNIVGNASSGWTSFGKIGNGLLFDGVNDVVNNVTILSSLNSPNKTNSVTVSLWTKLNGYGTSQNPTFVRLANSYYMDYRTDNNFVEFFPGFSASTRATSTTALALNTWYNLIGTYDGSKIKIYVNGNLEATTSATDVIRSVTADGNTNGFLIGGYRIDDFRWAVNGTIDEVRIWNRSLSADEIAAEYQRGVQHNMTVLTNLGQTKNAKYTPYEGLVGFWKLNDGDGVASVSTAKDSSGFGYTGTLTGINTTGNTSSGWNSTDCKFGSCLNFDGVNDYVSAGDVLDLGSGSFSVEGWIRPFTVGSPNKGIISKFQGSNFWMLQTDGYDLTFQMNNDLTSVYTMTANNWYHVVGVRDTTSSSVKLYVNGVQTSSVADSGGTVDNTGNLVIGARSDLGSTRFFNGTIDNVKIYKRALSPDEIKWEYLSTKDDYTGNYFFQNNTNDQVLFSARNWKDKITYNFTTNVSSTIGNNITHAYIFNSTHNNNLMFTLGYADVISTANFDANIKQIGFSNETLEQVAGSTLTYYDLLDNKLIGWWKFNENNNTITDYSGFNNTGTGFNGVQIWTNSSCQSGFGYCAYFDGSNDRVNVSDSSSSNAINGTNKITISFWFNPSTTIQSGSSSNNFITKGNSPVTYQIYSAGDGKIYVGATGDTNVISTNTVSWAAGNWYLVTFTYDGTTAKIYSNGIQESSSVKQVTFATTTDSMAIGAHSANQNYFNGLMDNVKIYSRALSADEILWDYQQQKENYPNWFKINQTGGATSIATTSFNYDGGASAIFHLDEGSGNITIDASGNNNFGSLGNSTTYTIPTWVSNSSCRFGSCLNFNGSQYANISDSNSLDIGSTHSVSMWVYLKNIPAYSASNANRIVPLRKYDSNRGYMFSISDDLSAQTGFVSYTIGDSSGYNYLNSGTALSVNQWYHLVGIYDGSVLKIYINGKLDGSKTIGAQGIGTTANLLIASVESGNFNGYMDEVRVYPRALTDYEVWDHYSQGVSKYYDDFNVGAKRNYGVEDSSTNLQPITPNGTILHLRFNDNSTVNVTDVSGYGNNGRNVGTVTWLTNSSCKTSFGGCMSFDGSNDQVTIPYSSSLNTTNALTISAWIKYDSVGAQSNVIVDKRPADNSKGWSLSTNDVTGGMGFYLQLLSPSCGGNPGPTDQNVILTNKWYHVVGTYDGSNIRVYVNGTLGATAACSGTLSIDSSDVWIANNEANPIQFTDGTIDEVMVINRSLSASEIYQLYLGGYNRTVGGHTHRIVSADGLTAVVYNLTESQTSDKQGYSQFKLFAQGFTDSSGINVIAPLNDTYDASEMNAQVNVNTTASWCGRSLDSGSNITMTNSSGNWNNLLTGLTAGAHNIIFYCNNTAGDMFSSDLVRFTTGGNFTFYNLRGIALNYLTGAAISSGNVTVTVKETGRTNTSVINNGNWVVNVSTIANYNQNRMTFGVTLNTSDGITGYDELVLGSGSFISPIPSCTYRPWAFSGYVVNLASGFAENSGTISVSIDDIPFSNSTSNSTGITNGYFNLRLYPCLVSGNTYTLRFTTYYGGTTSKMLTKVIAK